MEINIGDLALLTFIDDLSEENQLKAIFSLDFNDKEKISTSTFCRNDEGNWEII